MPDRAHTRRSFLKAAGATVALAACTRSVSSGTATPNPPSRGDAPPEGPVGGGPRPEDIDIPSDRAMPTRKLGRTGVEVSILGIGGYHMGVPGESEGIRIVREAIDHGVTFLDNCWDYNDGRSEERMGKALKDGYRDRVFLMTKLDGRTADAASAQLEQSLRRLATDRIDLVQIHEVIRTSDPGRVFAPGGAIEALVRAREQGKIRFIGFTGHKSPAIHRQMLADAAAHGFTFDTVQMPLNVMDAHFDSFEAQVLPILVQQDIGVLGMKPMGSGLILESGIVSPIECLHYTMSLPTSVTITGCDTLGVMRQAVRAALTFEPMRKEAMDALLARTAGAARKGDYEQYKTTERFDGTTKNPKWLDSASI